MIFEASDGKLTAWWRTRRWSRPLGAYSGVR